MRTFILFLAGAIAALPSLASTLSDIRWTSNGNQYVNDTILDGFSSPLGVTSTSSVNEAFLNRSDSTVSLTYGTYYLISFRGFGAHVGAGSVSLREDGTTPYSQSVTFPDPTQASANFATFTLTGGDTVTISATGLSADRIRIVADGGGLAPDGTPDAFYMLTYTNGSALATPEPASIALFTAGLMLFGVLQLRRSIRRHANL